MSPIPQTFAGKAIAVTGAGSGIGRAVAIYLAERGASVAMSDVNKGPIDAVAAEINAIPGAKAIAYVVDVSKPDQVKSWIAEVVATLGRLDGAANIAGVGGTSESALAEETDDGWDKIIQINLTGTMYCMREELAVLKDGGSIVNASSVLGLRSSPVPGAGSYVASKHGVLGLTRQAAREYGHLGTRINCVNPGAIATPMMGVTGEVTETPLPSFITSPLQRWGTPLEIAQAVGFLLGDESRFINGTSLIIDGGLMC